MTLRANFHKTWRVPGSHGDLLIVPGKDVRMDTRVVTYSSGLPAQLDRWLADPLAQRAALEMYAAIGGHLGTNGQRRSDSDLIRYLKPKLTEAFRNGELIILPAPSMMFGAASGNLQEGSPAASQSSGTQAPSRPQIQKTWIEIELLDPKGKPVPSERYRIQAPDGTFHNGTLDSNGRARLTDIDRGECVVSFPDIDGNEWQPV